MSADGSPAGGARASFLRDVLDGLSRTPRELPCKYFYDAEGSRLFDRICTLDAYYVTRTEAAILEASIDEMAAFAGADALVVEPGCGSGDKTRLLLERLETPAAYVPVDISPEPLERFARAVRAAHPALEVRPVHADFTGPFVLPATGRVARSRVLFFPGSTIGNMVPERASDFLAGMARVLGPGARALVGIDLQKDPAVLERAYDDPEGVTAAFNRNLLVRVARELGGRLEPEAFRHVARYDLELARIEIYLESVRAQRVTVGDRSFDFRAGERILTELSHKYTPDGFARIAARAGFSVAHVWTDPRRWFAVVGLTAGA